MDPHGFLTPGSASGIRIPDADADPDEATEKLVPKF
jgi:hypothetical protein